MHLPPKILQFGATVLVVASLPISARATDSPVCVKLVDGECVRAVLDRRTDQDTLWLTTSLGSGSLSQSIPWEDVRQVEISGQSFEGRVVRAAVATVRDASPGISEVKAPLTIRLEKEDLSTGWRQQAKPRVARPQAYSPPKVQGMTVSAWLDNWDQDVNVDGLVVEVAAYDSYGNPLSCDGTVSFSLQAWKTSGRDRHLEVRPERWTRNVRAEDFGAGSVYFRLPFRTVQPHTGSDWWSHGVLQIRLAVPGSGVVERTLSDLRLRHAEPMRDTWELYTGRRYFPGENVRRHAWSPR